ncbi:phage baseplate assembly protein, partial [Rhodoplanes serenus]|uniref:phage baseplate assembly protein n=1 Tax=Rhodoplanes serenus TaxID=200615 RepID=UPI000DBC11EF
EVLQFKPGDACTIYLAGQLAVTGYITMRQAAYDAESHGVQLTGKGKTWDIASSSVETEDGKFDGYPWEAIARNLIAPFGISL